MKLKFFTILSCIAFSSVLNANAQQFSLYNSRTLYDAFENPAQKAFKADTSRKYAFNFFIPNFGLNMTASGDAQFTFRTLLAKGAYTGQKITLGQNKMNTIVLNNNFYLLMFRIFRSVNHDKEMGFAWQIHSDTRLDISNETIAILDNFRLFSGNNFTNPLNNKGLSQNYHQFSFNYREDWDKKLGLGVKLSYISGIAYNKLKIDSSAISINREQETFDLYLDGQFRSNFLYDETDKKMLYPGFKNPGFAVTTSMTFKPGNGWYLLGNLKDIGFIKWSKKSYDYTFKQKITANNRNVGTKIDSVITASFQQKGYMSVLNGKAEVLVNKNLGAYQPNLLLSKNLFYKGGDVGLINNYSFGKFNMSLSTVYNTANIFQVGGMAMYKSPDFEFFMGTDHVFKTYYAAKSIITSDNTIGKGYTGASFYLGFAIKYGPSMEHPMNANLIPGVESAGGDQPGFFKRIFKKKVK